MKRHAAQEQRRLVWDWLPWVMVIAGIAGLLLLVLQPRKLPEQPEQPSPPSPPVFVTTAPEETLRISTVPEPAVAPRAPRPTVPRFVERITTDSTRRPLSLPLPMERLDTLPSLPPLETIP